MKNIQRLNVHLYLKIILGRQRIKEKEDVPALGMVLFDKHLLQFSLKNLVSNGRFYYELVLEISSI